MSSQATPAAYHAHTGKRCDNEQCAACHPPGPGRAPQMSVHLRAAPFALACGRKMRPLNAPKVDKDGKPISYPAYGYTFDSPEVVSCSECRLAANLGPWDGSIVPRRWQGCALIAELP